MKTFLSIFFMFSFFTGFGQDVDSTYIKQVDSLIKVSRDYTAKRNFNKALELNEKAEKIAIEQFGRESSSYGSCAHNHGRILYNQGTYTDSENWYNDAISIRGKVLGKMHPEYAQSLYNLGALYNIIGKYENGITCILESKKIRENTLGKEHPDYAQSVLLLGTLNYQHGNYQAAELLYFEAKTIFEKIFGIENSNYFASLANLGMLYSKLGNFEKAESIYLDAINKMQNTQSTHTENYGAILGNLASIYLKNFKYEKAEPLFFECLKVIEKYKGKNNLEYGNYLTNLATCYFKLEKKDTSEQIFLQSLNIFEKVLGNEHPYYAVALNNVAVFYSFAKKYEMAIAMHIEARKIREKIFGKENPDYLSTLDNLSQVYMVTGEYDKAEPLLIELAQGQRKIATNAAHHLTELEMYKNLIGLRNSQNNLLSFCYYTNGKMLSTECYNDCLFYKGFLFNTIAKLKKIVIANPTSENKFIKLKSLENQLASLLSKPIANRKGITELDSNINEIQKDLNRTIGEYSSIIKEVKWDEVQLNLKVGEATVEFIHFLPGRIEQIDSTMYAALVLLPDKPEPLFIPLFEEKELESILGKDAHASMEKVMHVYSPTQEGGGINTQQKNLTDLIYTPLKSTLQGVKKIYYSPSGLLHRINFDAIPLGLDKVWSDQQDLVLLQSTRQLVIPQDVKPGPNNAVLFGGITYNRDTTLTQKITSTVSTSTGELSFRRVDSTLRGGSWKELSGTIQEIQQVNKTLQKADIKTQIFTGTYASEESIKQLGEGGVPSPRILHIATHGYFFPDPASTPLSHLGDNEPVFKISNHPMLRSGLILAGGNAGWKGEKIPEGKEDGVLTAYEISQMNLSTTELVVLSACETGLGTIKGNEGVYGLQRAFKIAGAKHIMMSLWQVSDKHTAKFMNLFYKKWLEEKLSIGGAFHAAQKSMRASGLDPFFWAGFVLVE